MRVFITGGTGGIGPHIIRRLLRAGHEVMALARSHRSAANLPRETRVHIGDLLRPQSLEGALEGVEVVVHAAAAVGHGCRPTDHDAVTIRGTAHVLDAARRSGARRFVHLSTLAVHRPPQRGEILREDSPLWDDAPRWSDYTRAKLAAERLVQNAGGGADGHDAVILRPGVVLGPGDRHATPRLLQFLQRRTALLVGDPDGRVPCLAVEELADCVVRASEQPDVGGRVYVLAGREPVTQRELWRHHAQAAGLPEPMLRLPRFAVEAGAAFLEAGARAIGRESPVSRFDLLVLGGDAVVDCTRARSDLGWLGGASIADSVARAVKSIKPTTRAGTGTHASQGQVAA